MRTAQASWNETSGWGDGLALPDADLVLYFGTRQMLSSGVFFDGLRDRFPAAQLLGCSTGGQIDAGDVTDERVTALALKFSTTRLRAASVDVADSADSARYGADIGRQLEGAGLAGIFVLSDGLNVNGSALVEGMVREVGRKVQISGGLAGDGASFAETLVGCNAPPAAKVVAAVGFYGSAVRFGHGSAGGWDVFGPLRTITRSTGNILHAVDGEPALDLYKLYLGPDERLKLPGSALLYPLRVFDPRHPDRSVVRTVLAVDQDNGSMTFAGDMPEGWSTQLMRGSFSRLSAGAAEATRQATSGATGEGASAAILVSCIGRRLLMGQRVDEEIEAALSGLAGNCTPIGFYSYGEISPHGPSAACQLHNQTMTVTVVSELGA